MARRKPSQDENRSNQFDVSRDGLSVATRSQAEAFALNLFKRTVDTIWVTDNTDQDRVDKALRAAYDALKGIAPRNETEGMLAAQMIGTHNAALECLRRAMIDGQTFEGRDQNLKHAAKFMALYERQVAALDKHRGKGKQKITVEHVNVHAGGQAIVGDVNAGDRSSAASAEDKRNEPEMLSDESAARLDGEKLKQATQPRARQAAGKKRE